MKVQSDIPDDPRRIEEILADEIPMDGPEATEKTAVRFISRLLLWLLYLSYDLIP